MRTRANSLCQQKGFSLIEILVTVILLAIGLMGLAALQTRALKDNDSAKFRGQAVTLANDIIERMRANPTAARSEITADNYTLAATKPDVIPGPGAFGKRNSIAEIDLETWVGDVVRTLPGGTAEIQVEIQEKTVGVLRQPFRAKVTVVLKFHDRRARDYADVGASTFKISSWI